MNTRILFGGQSGSQRYMGILLLIFILVIGHTPLATAKTIATNTFQLSANQLQKEIRGTVKNEEGELLQGVSISVTDMASGASTDANGAFHLLAPEGSKISFSYLGYDAQQVTIGKQTTLEITLKSSDTTLDDIVVVGYNTQRKVDLTGAISVVDTEVLQNSPTPNPIKALQGQVPGVSIISDGNPAGGAQVRIRGVSTLNNNDPLYIIDGVPTKSSAFQILNSNDIESIQILKDASSAAIYGARASNGVIIVTTKQAKSGRTQINYSSAFTQSKYTSKPSMLNTEERARVQWQATINDGGNPDNIPFVDYDWTRDARGKAILNGITIPEYIIPGVRSANTNWFDAISRTGLTQEHNLSISSGGENTGSVISFRYYNDDYVLKGKNNQRVSARVNTYQNLFNKTLKIGQNLTVSSVIDNGFSGTLPLERALSVRPILPIYNDDGNYSGPVTGAFTDDKNPFMILDINRWDQRKDVNIFGNLYANAQLTKDLKVSTNFGIDWRNGLNRDIERIFDTGIKKRLINSLRNANSEDFNWNFNTTLQYNLRSERSDFEVLLGTELIKNNSLFSSSYREEFALETLDYFVENAGSGKQIVSGSRAGYSLLSYFGKVNYAFDKKYLVSATARYDGSSRFGSNNRFGFFPSISMGWKLEQEKFIAENLPFISELKLRGSWGVTGNQEISNIARYTTYLTHYGENEIAFNSDNGTAYDISGVDSGPLPSGYRKTQSGNDNLKWEETSERNIGLDFSIIKNKISGSFDYFFRNTKDILISPAYLAAVGEGGNRFINGASMKTKGFEAFLKYNDHVGAVNYSITANIGHYKDQITHLPADVINSYPGNTEQNILGRSMHSIFGYVADGIFKSQEEVDAHANQPGKGIGRLKFKDLNGDGSINSLDQKYLGVSSPTYEYGTNINLEYKNFDLRIFFQGIFGREVNNVFKRRTDFTSLWAGINYGTRTLGAWSPDNPNSTIPAVTLVDNNNEGRLSSYYIDNGAYLKLRQASLGYTVENLKFIKNARVYVTGDNLLTLKDNSGDNSFTSPDPENPYNAFPRPRSLTLGVNLTF